MSKTSAAEAATQAATQAATAAEAAIALATTTSITAKALADAKTASDIALAVMGNDISHIKTDILEIKSLFVKASSEYSTKDEAKESVADSVKIHTDHETRIRSTEKSIDLMSSAAVTWRYALSVAIAILTLAVAVLAIYHK